MPTLGFNFAKGYTEHQCEVCGNIVPWIETNMFGECKDCAAEINGESTTRDESVKEEKR